jgi:hypothetical protein
MFALLVACLLTVPCIEVPCVTVAGDSVIVVVAVADNATAQTVAVDSVEVTAHFTPDPTKTQVKRVAKSAGSTSVRFAFPLTLWTPGNTRGGPVSVRLGRIAACTGGVCWSGETMKGSHGAWAWSYLLDATAPAPAEVLKITVTPAALN